MNDFSVDAYLVGDVYSAWRRDQITEDAVPRELLVAVSNLTSGELHLLARRLQRLSTEIRSIIETRKANVDER